MSWCCVAPILEYGTEKLRKIPFHFGNGVRLDKIPKFAKTSSVKNHLSHYQRTRISTFRCAFIIDYQSQTAASSNQVMAEQKIVQANLSLWLAQPSGVGFRLVMHFDDQPAGTWNLVQDYSITPIAGHKSYANLMLEFRKIRKAVTLCQALQNRKGSVQTATYFVWSALREQNYVIRYILFWTALESLFGPDSSGETTHQLCERIALFLAPRGKKAQKLYSELKKAYGLRSTFVHGKTAKPGKASDDVMLLIEMLIRQALLKILRDQGLMQTFCSNGREKYLKDLIFN